MTERTNNYIHGGRREPRKAWMSVPFAACLRSESGCPHVAELSFSLLEAALSLAAAGDGGHDVRGV